MNGANSCPGPETIVRRRARLTGKCSRWWWVAGTLLVPSVVRAQEIAPARDDADRAFEEGRALFAQGKVGQACRQFATSYALRPRHGTLLNLAVCLEENGDQIAALSRFQESLTAAISDGRADRVELAKTHIDRLRSQLSWLTIQLQGTDPPGLRIWCDDAVVAGDWHKPIPVKAGKHVVRASATGRVPFEGSVAAAAGARQTIEVPALAVLAAATSEGASTPPISPVTASPVTSKPRMSQPNQSDAAPRTWQTRVAMPLITVGLASVAVGGILGSRAIADANEIDRICKDRRCTSGGSLATAEHLEARGRTEARVADLTLPIGALAVAAGAYFVFKKPAPSQTAKSSSTRFEVAASATPYAVATWASATW